MVGFRQPGNGGGGQGRGGGRRGAREVNVRAESVQEFIGDTGRRSGCSTHYSRKIMNMINSRNHCTEI
eukprot:9393034-Pyramimonas_sp.AAC.2